MGYDYVPPDVWEKARVVGDTLAKVIGILLLASAVILPFKAWYDNVYPLSRDVIAHVEYAMSITEARAIAEELEIALRNLEPYHGNPAWLFPTVETDFDYIKKRLRDILEATREIEDLPPSSYAYQRYIENIQRALPKIKDMLNSAAMWKYFNPLSIILAITWIMLAILFATGLLQDIIEDIATRILMHKYGYARRR